MKWHNTSFILLLTAVSCMSVESTNKTKNEKVVAKVHEAKLEDQQLAMASLKPQIVASRDGVSEIAGPAVSLAAEGIKKLIAIDSKKYTAQYQAAVTENYFYHQPSAGESSLDPRFLKFDGLKISRYVTDKNNKEQLALYMSLKMDHGDPADYDKINNSLFRLVLDDFKIPYFKCKVPESRWFMPWTWFYKKGTTVNVDVAVSIKASWITKEGLFFDKVEIGKFITQFKDFPIDTAAQKNYVTEMKKKKKRLDGYSMLVPRSYGYYADKNGELVECYGQGMYSVTLDIKESSRGNFITSMVEDNASTIIDSGVKSVKTKYSLK